MFVFLGFFLFQTQNPIIPYERWKQNTLCNEQVKVNTFLSFFLSFFLSSFFLSRFCGVKMTALRIADQKKAKTRFSLRNHDGKANILLQNIV